MATVEEPKAGAGAGAGSGPVSEEGKAFDYDLIVIGGGSGGLACSKAAAELGARVAVLDFVKPSPAGSTWGLGGTCVNVGCIPKKLFHTASLLGEGTHDAEGYGWEFSEPAKHNWVKLVDAIQDHISSLNFGYRVELRGKSVSYLNALGSFVDPHTLECVDKRGKRSTITGHRFVLAVGGRPRPLDIPGGDLAISSDDIFSLAKPPGKTLCIGASYVSLECAGFLKGLGFDVSVMVRSILLRGFDQQAAELIGRHMKTQGVKMIRSSVPVSIVKQDDGKLLVAFKNVETGEESTDVFDTVMAAIGRDADTKGLNLDAVGVVTEANGKIKCVNEQTNVEHVYALGDILAGGLELTPVAIQAGRLLAARLFGGATKTMDYSLVPTTVFTPLEYGCIGYAEAAARDKFGTDNIEVYLIAFTPLEWTLPPSRTAQKAFGKLVCNTADDSRVVGLHYLGPNAGEVAQGFATAMRLGATHETMLDTVGIHPTCAEEFTTMTVALSSGQDYDKSSC